MANPDKYGSKKDKYQMDQKRERYFYFQPAWKFDYMEI
jgi:hypothetical protein